MRTRLLALALTWACALPGTLVAAGAEPARDGFEAERTRAVRELIAGLEKYAEWCSNKKIWVERNRALTAILVVDPGNMDAKRGLGWNQVADGVWEPPSEPKPAKNFDPSALKEAPARYADAIRPWRDKLVALLAQHQLELTPAQRDSVHAEILSIDPDDALVREARGEARVDGLWVLKETERAKPRRAEIRRIVAAALAAAPKIEDRMPGASDLAFQIDWKNSVATDRVRVLTTGERAEAARIAQVLHASQDVFQDVFMTQTVLPEGFTIYLLLDPQSKATFIANIPDATEAQRSFYAQVDGSGFNALTSAAWWSPTADRRLDGVTRHAIGTLLQTEFQISVDIAWAWESLGLYLGREMVGTRLTWYIVPVDEARSVAGKKGSVDWTKKLLTPGTNWMNEGYRLVREGDARNLGATLTRPLNKMTPKDLFVSYAVGAYLLEGQAERLPQLLRTLGAPGERTAARTPQALSSALAMDIDTFHGRLVRWLGERR